MKGDFTRFSYNPQRRYSRVLKQQGRVDLDSDWNEAVEIFTQLERSEARDVIGRSGVPEDPEAYSMERTEHSVLAKNTMQIAEALNVLIPLKLQFPALNLEELLDLIGEPLNYRKLSERVFLPEMMAQGMQQAMMGQQPGMPAEQPMGPNGQPQPLPTNGQGVGQMAQVSQAPDSMQMAALGTAFSLRLGPRRLWLTTMLYRSSPWTRSTSRSICLFRDATRSQDSSRFSSAPSVRKSPLAAGISITRSRGSGSTIWGPCWSITSEGLIWTRSSVWFDTTICTGRMPCLRRSAPK